MGYFDEDALAMLDVYQLETRQLIEKLDEILLEDEKKKMLPIDDIHHIFRVMHTIKSSSAMMGLSDLSVVAHDMEDLFALFRDDPALEKGWEEEIFELLFQASDFVKKELQRMMEEDYEPLPTKEMIGSIRQILEKIKPQAEKVQEAAPRKEAHTDAMITLKVWFENGCMMENVRAFMLMRQIRTVCPEAVCDPADPEKDSKTAEVIADQGFLVSILPVHLPEVLKIIRSGAFVKSCEQVGTPEGVTAGSWEKAKQKESPRHPEIPEEKAEPKNREAFKSGTGNTVQTPEQQDAYINVRTERLDALQNLTGEFMILISELRNQIKEKGYQDLEEQFGYSITQLLGELEENVRHMRMMPVAQIVPKLKRIVRDAGKKLGKDVEFVVTGQEVEADKKIVEQLFEASMHIVRNSVDHGIELSTERAVLGKQQSGTICFDVKSCGGELLVEIRDDGKGMDPEKLLKKAKEKGLLSKPEEEYTLDEILELSTLPGLSTNHEANEYSGRGVGMDIVRKLVEDSGGGMRIESTKGKGTAIYLNLPQTHMIVDAILFTAGGRIFGIPAQQVSRFLEWEDVAEKIESSKENYPSALLDGKLLPVIDVAEAYGLEEENKDGILMQVNGLTQEACFQIDQVLGEEKIVLKPLPALFGPRFQSATGINGCSIMGNGDICMFLDAERVIRLCQRGSLWKGAVG
ncbi:MAG: chemotaxis protein CheA [Blautia sp.]|jgi:two-component system chemotaxis sensor kinase CheA